MIRHVLSMIVIALAIAYALQPTKEEGFQDAVYDSQGAFVADKPSAILTGNTAWSSAFGEDNPLDLPWIASWSPADQAARKGQNCAVLYSRGGPEGTTIVTTSRSCEAGMAHTRPGDRIFLPDSIPQALHEHTIRHEMIHIYQRRDPVAWAQFYRRQWAFMLFMEPPASMPASVLGARRNNPDLWVPGSKYGGTWPCWKGRYWVAAVYKDPKNPQLRDAITVWWDDWRQNILTQPPADWVAFFGDLSQNEHPHEIAAVLLTAEDTNSEAGRRLMSWWLTKGSLLKADPLE